MEPEDDIQFLGTSAAPSGPSPAKKARPNGADAVVAHVDTHVVAGARMSFPVTTNLDQLCGAFKTEIHAFSNVPPLEPCLQYNGQLLLDTHTLRASGIVPDAHVQLPFRHQQQRLATAHLATLSRFCDFMWERHAKAGQRDLKLVLPPKLAIELLAPLDAQFPMGSPLRAKTAVGALQALFQRLPGRAHSVAKLALRVTRGNTGACIAFHCDGFYATSTTQIALNDPSEYVGGKLCFYAGGALTVLRRPAGALTHHRPNVLHAVTALHSGCRKSLFVLDETNGLGEGDVLNVSGADLTAFCAKATAAAATVAAAAASVAEPAAMWPTCAVCMDSRATQAPLPCGHLCLCRTCEPKMAGICPECQGPFETTLTVRF